MKPCFCDMSGEVIKLALATLPVTVEREKAPSDAKWVGVILGQNGIMAAVARKKRY